MAQSLTELKNALGLEALSEIADREWSGVYAGDLLSWVMSHAEAGNVWVTIMSNTNVIAVASLVDVACVILSEGVTLDEKDKTLAVEKGIAVFTTPMSTYEVCDKISHLPLS